MQDEDRQDQGRVRPVPGTNGRTAHTAGVSNESPTARVSARSDRLLAPFSVETPFGNVGERPARASRPPKRQRTSEEQGRRARLDSEEDDGQEHKGQANGGALSFVTRPLGWAVRGALGLVGRLAGRTQH